MTPGLPVPIPYFLMGKIRRGIITGRYPPGSPLREQTLETEYGVSRGPLREALRLLQLRGIVTHEPRRGFRVREYSAELTEQVYRLRGLLERHSIEALAGKPLDELVVQLRAANKVMAQCFAVKDIEGYLEANVAFHDAILHTANNEPLRKSLEVLNEMAQPIRFALLTSRFEKSTAMGEHDTIIGLLVKGDLERAALAIEQHVVGNIKPAAQLYRPVDVVVQPVVPPPVVPVEAPVAVRAPARKLPAKKVAASKTPSTKMPAKKALAKKTRPARP
jgi:DNA-binding GntR family transcriptional regulator